jgi:hypothetical protein
VLVGAEVDAEDCAGRPFGVGLSESGGIGCLRGLPTGFLGLTGALGSTSFLGRPTGRFGIGVPSGFN